MTWVSPVRTGREKLLLLAINKKTCLPGVTHFIAAVFKLFGVGQEQQRSDDMRIQFVINLLSVMMQKT